MYILPQSIYLCQCRACLQLFMFFYIHIRIFHLWKFTHRFKIRLAFLLRISYGKNNQKYKWSEPWKNLTRAKAKLALEILGSQAMNFFVFVVRCSCKMLIWFFCLLQNQATPLLNFFANKNTKLISQDLLSVIR